VSYRIVDADLDEPSHAAGLVHCIDAYASEDMGGGHALSAEVKARLVPGLKEHPERLVLLALDERGVVGAAVCFMGYSTFAAKPRLNVHDLCVLAEHRGHGLGRRLMEAVLERARLAGCSAVSLEVRGDNAIARRLYQSLGFGAGLASMEFWVRPLG
jgi:ribosomal protein S18 acetylase RimI-like enzyme